MIGKLLSYLPVTTAVSQQPPVVMLNKPDTFPPSSAVFFHTDLHRQNIKQNTLALSCGFYLAMTKPWREVQQAQVKCSYVKVPVGLWFDSVTVLRGLSCYCRRLRYLLQCPTISFFLRGPSLAKVKTPTVSKARQDLNRN